MRKLIWLPIIGLGLALLVMTSFVAALSGGLSSNSSNQPSGAASDTALSIGGLSNYALRTIPAYARSLYTNPAVRKVCPPLPPAVLAGIGTVETDNGLNISTSTAGAEGFMQFEPATFAKYGVAVNHPGPPQIMNNLDSVASAANLLCRNWDKRNNVMDLARVIRNNYNHAWWYACNTVPGCPTSQDGPGNQPPYPGYRGVMAWAQLYEAPVITLTSAAGPTVAATKALAFAEAQIGLPYVYGGTGPPIYKGYDCSGLVMEAYMSAGINIPRTSEQQWSYGQTHWQFIPANSPTLLPGDLVFFNPGEQLPDLPGHVAMVEAIKGNTVWVVQAPQPGEHVENIRLGTIRNGVFYGPHDLAIGWDYIGAYRPT